MRIDYATRIRLELQTRAVCFLKYLSLSGLVRNYERTLHVDLV